MKMYSAITMAVVMAMCLATLFRISSVEAKPFKYRSYGQMVAYLKELNATYPELLRVYIAQDKYNLPYPQELACVEDDTTRELVPCKHFVVHMTNHSTLSANKDRPQVFFSGALHGNERIGPITTIEMIALVAKLATAYANPGSPQAKSLQDEHPSSIHTQRWLHHLVNSRDVVITPMTNAYGYSHETREELSVDPNRDYNYMRSGQDCMQTMTSRVVNELWRDHIFQLAITFHGGMRAISYEWGSPNHYLPSSATLRSQKSPDDAAQASLANTLAVFAGQFADKTLYPTGTMNDIVYGVTGGMEDWGYAASWENQFVMSDSKETPFKPCEPTTFGGYPANKTVYNNITHRAFNILVETSNNKHPLETALGQFEDLYRTELDFFAVQKSGVPALGHVSQNVRLALMLMEMVQPYVRWVEAPFQFSPQAATSESAYDRFPSASLFVRDSKQLTSMGCGAFAAESAQIESCNSTKCYIELEDDGKPLKLQVAWEVLGAITVDLTHLQLASDPSFLTASILSESAVQKGTTRRFFDLADSKKVASGTPDNTDTLGTSLFVSCVDLQGHASQQKLYLRAVAVVDQDWKAQAASGDDEPSPHIPPQSHYVNARTNPAWRGEWNGFQVQGSLNWYSPTIEVTVAGSPAKSRVTTSAPVTSVAAETTAVVTTAPTVATTVTPTATTTPTTSILSETPSKKDEDEGEDDDDEVATEPEITTPEPTPAKPKAAAVVPPMTPSPTQADDGVSLTGVQKAGATLKKGGGSSSSLIGYGYLTLGLGGLIITLTLTYLYKRVFRSKRRAAYTNINRQRPQRSTLVRTVQHGEDDDEDEDDL